MLYPQRRLAHGFVQGFGFRVPTFLFSLVLSRECGNGLYRDYHKGPEWTTIGISFPIPH